MNRDQRLGCLFMFSFSIAAWAVILWAAHQVGTWLHSLRP